MGGEAEMHPPPPRGGRSAQEWAKDVVRTLCVLTVILGSVGFGGLAAKRSFELAELAQDLHHRSERMLAVTRGIEIWLEAEQSLRTQPSSPFGARIADRASPDLARLEEEHEGALDIAWRLGLAGDVTDAPSRNLASPAHHYDVLVRGFLRGASRLSERTGDRRDAAREDLLHVAERELKPWLHDASVLGDLLTERLRRRAWTALAVGAAGVGLGVLLMIHLHLRGPRRRLGRLRARLAGRDAEFEKLELQLRRAERDRLRMLDIAGWGMTAAAERMEAASDLLARTPMTETQDKVLEGLRGALGEFRGRLDGLRLLCAAGDGRLRPARRPLRPGAIYDDWAAAISVRAEEHGRRLTILRDLDQQEELRGDGALLRDALDRMFDDALRRTGKGGRIRVAARFEWLDRGRRELRVLVEHDGQPPGPTEVASLRGPFAHRPPSASALPRGADPFGLAAAAAIGAATGGGLDVLGDAETGARLCLRMHFDPLGLTEEVLQQAEDAAAAPPSVEIDLDAAALGFPVSVNEPVERRIAGDRRRGPQPADSDEAETAPAEER